MKIDNGLRNDVMVSCIHVFLSNKSHRISDSRTPSFMVICLFQGYSRLKKCGILAEITVKVIIFFYRCEKYIYIILDTINIYSCDIFCGLGFIIQVVTLLCAIRSLRDMSRVVSAQGLQSVGLLIHLHSGHGDTYREDNL